MGIKFFEWLRGDRGKGSTVEVSCRELFEAAQEYQVRELCFWICVNMVANAIGRCEFRTFRDGVELQDREYYLWNVSPTRTPPCFFTSSWPSCTRITRPWW